MNTSANPFLDHKQRHVLYGDAHRLTQRTSALSAAKISGAAVAEVIAGLGPSRPSCVLDVGCGRGGTTAYLARAWSPDHLTALDASAAMLDQARARVTEHAPDIAGRVRFVCADFHDIPALDDHVDVIVAAFCLYHAPKPGTVLAEFRRCLRPGGRIILVTKSADSYAALDELVAASGLDPDATRRPSLYESFHSGNAETITAQHLRVDTVAHHQHRFHFTDAAHTARYVATNPKYRLPQQELDTLTERLDTVLRGHGVATDSAVTYVVASKT
ncbi:class I SAM-dependent methyltransferase [Amycolatopsis palatopharyngis]|uniref:class I SAM-dependent methyltransferase n=1 Tax=Amycolatopsis palatopharyngis TaxID=187982 RepID=UPI000E24D349|nr:class I SAM-dependent methyltransferase [Amycolatopsis palatopharyngis]